MTIKEPLIAWQPIAAAPKDGTYILLLGDSGYTTTPYRVAVGCWIEGYRNSWLTHSNDHFTGGGSPPTHWAPWVPPSILELEGITEQEIEETRSPKSWREAHEGRG